MADCSCGKVRKCKTCQKNYNQKWYQDNKETHKIRARERRQRMKMVVNQFIKEAKSKPCSDCKQSFPYYVMDFDHRDPSIKKGIVSKLKSYSLKVVKEEIEKCDLVCANCHRIRTFNGLMA